MAAETIARALGGQKAGSGWLARCPGHDDHRPSLSIRNSDDGKTLVHCHAGCDQAHVIAALRSRGLWSKANRGEHRTRRPVTATVGDTEVVAGDARRGDAALALWHSATAAPGTLVESYLISRGLRLPLPPTLRFHPGLRHSSGVTWPGMIALVTSGRDNIPSAIHRTFLRSDGAGKAPMDPQKMMLGRCRGGAVRLAAASDFLMVGEGIETCLATMQATGNPAWAALSTSGLRSLVLPIDVKDLIVLADGDEAGEAAARDCAMRWKHEGRRVRIARPPQGMDFNDMLMGRARLTEGAEQ